MKYMRMVLALAILLLTSVSAFAATNIYKDAYTTEDSAGQWTFTAVKENTTVVTFVGATSSTILAANNGTTYVVDGETVGSTGATTGTIVLPVAADGLNYKFITGDSSVIILAVAYSNITDLYTDTLCYGTIPATMTSLRLTAASGSTIEVHGSDSGLWYVSDAVGTWTPETRSTDIGS